MSSVTSTRRTANGPYRPTRDPQVLLLVGIVVAVVGLWVVGVMSPATLSGGESGPVFPFRDQSEDGQVSVSVNRSTVDSGEPVAVTVSVDGNPVSDATVRVADEVYATSGDGTVVVSVDDPGSYEVTGVRPDGNRSATTALRVRRFESALSVSVPGDVVTGASVPVRVTRANGDPVDAVVAADGETVRTGADGVANVTFAAAGEFEVRASKEPSTAYRFVDATGTVTVERRAVALVATANRSAPRVDEPVAVSVRRRDTGEAVNATLSLGGRTLSTGSDGVADVRFDAAGEVVVVASANRTRSVRFVDGRARVDVRRLPVDLSVSVTPERVSEGERARFVVRRADTGERVGATVELYGSAYSTGADGRVSFPFYAPGNATVSVAKASTARERYVGGNASFVVVGPEVVADSVAVPATAPADGTMRVNATLSNVGNERASEDAVVAVGSATTRVRTTVPAGETTDASWEVATPDETGNVTVVVSYEEVRVERTVRLVASDERAADGSSPNATADPSTDVTTDSSTNATVRERAAPPTAADSTRASERSRTSETQARDSRLLEDEVRGESRSAAGGADAWSGRPP
ncbi:hypothetical protein [Halorubellus sp. PRR65]|uniref:hypothetical protein n=1 Tax=Halorubellus sp. PRR65 TaxID=3098148 RepID=UPI002B256EE7|nr:hypothetical protein [Halorubellus sp. PRR65]